MKPSEISDHVRGVTNMAEAGASHMTAFRWWLSKRLNELAWWICPNPHKHMMENSWQAVKADWIKAQITQIKAAEQAE